MENDSSKSYDYLFKLLCVGEANVGKTTFLHQYIHDNFANFRSTVGIDIFEKQIIDKDNQQILLQLWDTAGQERYRSLTQSLFRDSMGFLLIFDVTNEASFLAIRDWLTFIDTYTRIDQELRPPIFLIGNKIDLVTNRVVDSIQAQQLANELKIHYIETSAVTGTNVQEALRLLIEQIFQFMNDSMQKFYPRQTSSIRLTTNRQQSTTMKIKNKIIQAKKHSCPCT